jgi:hypothetical protein
MGFELLVLLDTESVDTTTREVAAKVIESWLELYAFDPAEIVTVLAQGRKIPKGRATGAGLPTVTRATPSSAPILSSRVGRKRLGEAVEGYDPFWVGAVGTGREFLRFVKEARDEGHVVHVLSNIVVDRAAARSAALREAKRLGARVEAYDPEHLHVKEAEAAMRTLDAPGAGTRVAKKVTKKPAGKTPSRKVSARTKPAAKKPAAKKPAAKKSAAKKPAAKKPTAKASAKKSRGKPAMKNASGRKVASRSAPNAGAGTRASKRTKATTARR